MDSKVFCAELVQTARVRDCESPSSHQFSVASSICSSEESNTHESDDLLGHDDSVLNMEAGRVFKSPLGKIDLDFDDVTSSVTERLSPCPFKSILLVHRCEVPTIWPSPSKFRSATCGVTAYEYNGDLFLSLPDVFTGARNMCLWRGPHPRQSTVSPFAIERNTDTNSTFDWVPIADDACGRYSLGGFSGSGSQNAQQLRILHPSGYRYIFTPLLLLFWRYFSQIIFTRFEVLGDLLCTVDLPPIGHSQDPVVLRASATNPKRGMLLTTTCPPQSEVLERLEPDSCPTSAPSVGSTAPAPHAAKAQDAPDYPATLPFYMRLDASGAPLFDLFLSELKPKEIRNAYVPNGTWTTPIRVERHGSNTSPIIQPIFAYSKQSGSRYRKRPHHNKYPHLSTKVMTVKPKCLGAHICANSDCLGIDRPKGTSSVGSRSNTVLAGDGPKRHTHSTSYTLVAQLDDSDLTPAELADPNFETCGMAATMVIIRHQLTHPIPLLRKFMPQPYVTAQASTLLYCARGTMCLTLSLLHISDPRLNMDKFHGRHDSSPDLDTAAPDSANTTPVWIALQGLVRIQPHYLAYQTADKKGDLLSLGIQTPEMRAWARWVPILHSIGRSEDSETYRAHFDHLYQLADRTGKSTIDARDFKLVLDFSAA
ncbi:BQ5605_C014g07450 [Microbotryum silenes-dioicae]|uniref:BQ5605_C014g07450 protein n=1 Tax=Microbotryum silenes-dioicae TaxID=796604 RepID=A0A2X0NX35_9BASI|nr:BQ5605_C014g07450 [Microbotryum silenes-dioicae]